ncbi:MAG: SHOCT domain-containing protein, partial [Clostridia bacterium]|nr:SHOCT domain-containing protein [Clostridia bacterium]
LVVVVVPLMIVGLLFTFITYIFGRMFFSYLVDVKAIRNKLYDCDNDELYSFCGIEDTVGGEEDDEDNSQDSSSLATKLTELKSAYDCGALTKEEYEEQKRRIIND